MMIAVASLKHWRNDAMGNKPDVIATHSRVLRHEGFRSTVYLDHKGNPTIGHGFLIESLELFEPISAIHSLLLQYELTLSLVYTFPWFVDMPAQVASVIIEICYWMGIRRFMKFEKTIKYFKAKKFYLASKEMLDSDLGRDPMTRKRAKELSKIVAGVKNG